MHGARPILTDEPLRLTAYETVRLLRAMTDRRPAPARERIGYHLETP